MKHLFNAFRPILSDFIATIVFVAFYAITGSIYAAIPLGIAAGILQIAWLRYRRRPIGNRATWRWRKHETDRAGLSMTLAIRARSRR